MTLRIRRIDHARDFVALAPVWSRLANDTGQASPFSSYDWFWCCWHGAVPHRHPEILVVEDGNTPVAFIPLMGWRTHRYGLPIRYLGFLTWPHSPTADMVLSGHSYHIVELFLDYLTRRSDWDVVQLQKLSATAPTLEAFKSILPGRLSWHHESRPAPPQVTIDGDWAHFYNMMPKSSAETYQAIQTTLQRAGEIKLEEHRLIDPLSSLFQETVALINLQSPGPHINTITPRQQEFFQVLTQRAAKNGWLSLWTLTLNGHVMAFEYQLRFHSTVQVLATAENPSYHALRPWLGLNVAILQFLFENGCSYEYSLGPAVQNAPLWEGNCQHQTVDLTLYRQSLYTRLLARLDDMLSNKGQRLFR